MANGSVRQCLIISDLIFIPPSLPKFCYYYLSSESFVSIVCIRFHFQRLFITSEMGHKKIAIIKNN